LSRGRLQARCPAKVNLALRVVSRRPDGYHELDTVFQAVDLWDRLTIEAAEGLQLRCSDPGLPGGADNLVLRAAELLRQRFGIRAGARLMLEKAIPSRAGMGGGSSDAAAALLLCARFWGLRPDPEGLAAMAAELGADVPFFLVGGTARGRGRGDRVEPLPFIGPIRFLLGIPPFGISTAEVFDRVASRLTLPGNGVSLPPLSAHKWPVENDFAFAVNDLEKVVFRGWPELVRFRDDLVGAGAGPALLSGSGSAVFGVFDDPEALRDTLVGLSDRFPGWRLLAVRAVEAAAHVVD